MQARRSTLPIWRDAQRRRLPLPLSKPLSVAGYRGQVAIFRKRYPKARLCVQRGCEIDGHEPPQRDGRPAESRAPADAVRKAEAMGLRREVRQVNAVEAGYVKDVLKRQAIRALYSHSGVQLCPS